MMFISELKNRLSYSGSINEITKFMLIADRKKQISEYLRNRSFVTAASTKKIFDSIAKENDENYCGVYYSDGRYEWNSAEIMYFEKYDLKLNDDFIQHVLNQMNS